MDCWNGFFTQAGCPSRHTTNRVQALKAFCETMTWVSCTVTCSSAISCRRCSSALCCSLVWSTMFVPPRNNLLSIAWTQSTALQNTKHKSVSTIHTTETMRHQRWRLRCTQMGSWWHRVMETQRKDVKDLLYSRRLLMTEIMLYVWRKNFTRLHLTYLFENTAGCPWLTASVTRTAVILVDCLVCLYLFAVCFCAAFYA